MLIGALQNNVTLFVFYLKLLKRAT